MLCLINIYTVHISIQATYKNEEEENKLGSGGGGGGGRGVLQIPTEIFVAFHNDKNGISFHRFMSKTGGLLIPPNNSTR